MSELKLSEEGKTSGSPPLEIWVDVTGFYRWGGKPTGIPRTATCLADEWLKLEGGHHLRFFTFDNSLRSFSICEAEKFKRDLKRFADEHSHGVKDTSEPELGMIRLAYRTLWDFLRGAKRFVPETVYVEWKNAYNSVRKAAFHVGRAVYASLKRVVFAKIKGLLSLVLGARKEQLTICEFERALGPNSVIVSMGSSWMEDRFASCVGSLKSRTGCQVVFLVYDFIPCKFPHFFPKGFGYLFQDWAAAILKVSDLVLTISESSKRDVQDFASELKIECPKVEVIRLGDIVPVVDSDKIQPPKDFRFKEVPFVLSVGTIEVRKNHLLLYHAWSRLLRQHSMQVPALVVVGRAGWLVDDLLYMLKVDPIVREKVVHLKNISDAELTWLYSKCIFTVYPSLYEGWGLPIAESLGHGRYCIASNTSSMPEVGGELVDYHDPLNISEFCELLTRAALHPEYVREREVLIKQRYHSTSWSACAAQVRDKVQGHFRGLELRANAAN